MLDREKVIKGLEICSAGEWDSTGGRDHTNCPYYPAGYTGCTCKLLMRDALVLLKEQEVIEPIEMIDDYYPIGDPLRTTGWKCGKCGERIACHDNYCPNCGKAVKWE